MWYAYADWVPEDVKPHIQEKGETLYFAGCTASFVENDIGRAGGVYEPPRELIKAVPGVEWLMLPENMAALMEELFPQLVDAMPLGMGGMMRFVGKLGPVGRRVPMPDFMREQMPDLMPRAFDNLLPHMLPGVVPLISQPLIDYLRGKTPAKSGSAAAATPTGKPGSGLPIPTSP